MLTLSVDELIGLQVRFDVVCGEGVVGRFAPGVANCDFERTSKLVRRVLAGRLDAPELAVAANHSASAHAPGYCQLLPNANVFCLYWRTRWHKRWPRRELVRERLRPFAHKPFLVRTLPRGPRRHQSQQ